MSTLPVPSVRACAGLSRLSRSLSRRHACTSRWLFRQPLLRRPSAPNVPRCSSVEGSPVSRASLVGRGPQTNRGMA